MKTLQCLIFLTTLAACIHAYRLGIDISDAITKDQVDCLKKNSVSAIFVRAYKPDSNGTFDSNCVIASQLAHKAGLVTELYVTLDVSKNARQGYDQVDDLQKSLKKNSINVRRIWMKVTSDMGWNSDVVLNQGTISQVLGRLRQYSYTVGILTSAAEWKTLTNNWTQAGDDVFLWYHNFNGAGANGESSANFDDFVPFGVNQIPTIKQYGSSENVCGINVNKDCFK